MVAGLLQISGLGPVQDSSADLIEYVTNFIRNLLEQCTDKNILYLPQLEAWDEPGES